MSAVRDMEAPATPRFNPAFKDEVRRRTDLAELIGREVALKRQGGDFWGCCPFHGERTASFKISVRDGFYKCFGCPAGGDAFTWLMERHAMGFRGALEYMILGATHPDRTRIRNCFLICNLKITYNGKQRKSRLRVKISLMH